MLWIVLLGVNSLLLGACIATPVILTPYPTDTPVPPTATFTSSPVWFPATPTQTPLVTTTFAITPTVDIKPHYGEVIYTDNFNNPGTWNLGKDPAGSIALGLNELSLVITKERGYLYSLLQKGGLGDFYAEITASPTICRGEDEYGVLLRVSASLDFFRFSLTCDGQARVDKYASGRASSPVPLALSSAVPRGAPSNSRLGVWSRGREMRFYTNGVYLFSVNDTTLVNGWLGVFARASSADSVTVNFSALMIYEAEE